MSESQPPRVRYERVSADEAGQRLDNFLKTTLKGAPKGLIYRIIRKGEVRVNKRRAKPLQKLKAGDEVRVPPVRLGEPARVATPSDGLRATLTERVLFEDDALLVLDKPSGLAVHGGSGVHLGLIEVLRQIRPDVRFLELAHRLDRDTSGCILVAKKRSVLRTLHEALRQRRVEKRYVCLVYGHWPDRVHDVSAPLQRLLRPSGERFVRVSEEGKPALTRFRCLRTLDGPYSLMEARPHTGRTHQIRVHAASVGCPLVGDEKYASDDALAVQRRIGARRLMLHAAALGLAHPLTGESMWFEAPLPNAFDRFMERMTEGQKQNHE